jgi:hypothetical protein
MNYNGAFNPKFLSGTQLYFAKNSASVSSWNDQSPNGFNLTQAVALQQPTIGANSVDFDGSNDVLVRTQTSPFISHTQGIIFFSGYIIGGVVQRFINVSLSTAAVGRNRLGIEVNVSGNIVFVIRDGAIALANNFQTTATFGSGYVYGYIVSNGSSYTVNINGSARTLSFTQGVNDGKWFSFVGATNRISMGGLFTNSIVFYTQDQVNKLYYNNTSLSASDLWKTEQFFANPLNYD